MLLLTVRDGATRTMVRCVDGPVCVQVSERDDPWLAWPDDDGRAVTVLTALHEPVGRLAPGDALMRGGVTLSLDRGTRRDDTDRIVALRRRRPGLCLVAGGGRRHILGVRPLVLGTDPQCDVVLADGAVSARHCLVRPHRGQWLAQDLGSTNGLWVGGARVPAALLAPGMTLTLGRTTLAVEPETAPEPSGHHAIVGRSPAVLALREHIERYARAPYPVLIEGESGCGKELVARELHARSPRAQGPWVALNCGAIAPELIESELFGHEKGAFTGSTGRRRGVFEEAHGGTLFLDELGELPMPLQPKLLRVLETGELRRVGGEGAQKVDVRVLSATLRDLRARVDEGLFREDLYFRLADLRVRVPPLRERRADLPLLAEHLLARIELETGHYRILEDQALAKLLRYPFPGNVRELLSVLKRAAYVSQGTRIGPEHLELPTSGPATKPPVVERWPRSLPPGDLAGLLRWCEGNISRAAQIAGLARSTFRERVARQQQRALTGGSGVPTVCTDDDPDP
ncbi:MAG: sigma 54-dependent Fis family transcriptional regulator [Deltaproteobacteria bacterium]|nr:sigma 54-dependent Fis family transcriptional regulator [Deltaproteobacteria bacterium]